MRRQVAVVVALAALSSVPALAQQPSATDGDRHAKRECVMQHLGGLKADMKSHMQQFRAAHPGADQDARRAERRAFGKQMRRTHSSEIDAAKAACGVGHR